MAKPILSVFDTKPYDREYFQGGNLTVGLEIHFHEFRLQKETAAAAKGSHAACVFVNDDAGAEALQILAEAGVRHVALRCAGFNNLDLAAARKLGLTVTRVPSYSPYAVAEHTVALLLALNRHIYKAYNRVREFNFSLGGLVGFDLYGKTVGVIGTGKTGRLVAQILRGFGMNVLAFDIYPDAPWAESHGIHYTELEDIIRRSDILTLHVPLTPETDHLIDKERLALAKPGAILINVSRGRLVQTKALIAALKTGHLAGVALDVYEEEEGVFFEDHSGKVLQDDELARLLTFPNVLVTAHQAFLTREALTEIAATTLENVRRVWQGEPPLETTVLE